jgi:glycosyltransferase involved in cell wall biosynthesis
VLSENGNLSQTALADRLFVGNNPRPSHHVKFNMTPSFLNSEFPALAHPVVLAPPTMPWDCQSERIIRQLEKAEQLCRSELEAYAAGCQTTNTRFPDHFKVSIVIPVYNEEATIGKVVARVASLPFPKEIIVVDDRSTDGTFEVLAQVADLEGMRVIRHEQNQGKGAALRTGFENATGCVVVVQDADLEYDPRDIPGLLVPILHEEADIVYGSRFLSDDHQDKSWVHRFGNWALTASSNLFSGLHLTDMETCYKAFRSEALKCVDVTQNRFGIEPELTAKLARLGYRFTEVPISYQARSYAEGKKIGLKDLFNALYCIGRYGIRD